MGTPEFAVPSLSYLANSPHKIVSVLTQPDKPKGRNRKPCPSPIKLKAQELGLKIIQPVNINDQATLTHLAELDPDCIVVVAFGQILSYHLTKLPRYQCINIHSSLLPKYRGAAPINWAIIRGETITGVTSMVMVEKMDAGDIIMQKETPILPDEDAGELEKRLAVMGADVSLETLKNIESGNVTYTRQNESDVTFAPKLKKEDGLIHWAIETQKIHNLVRGTTPAPGAYTFFQRNGSKEKKRIGIVKTRIHEKAKRNTSAAPGTIVELTSCGIHVATKDDFICVTKLQPEGKRIMSSQEYMRGYKIANQDMFISQQ